MLIVKGTRIAFDMKDGTRISAPASSAMMHDPAGRTWSRCSLLIGPLRRNVRAPTEKETEGAPTHYLGRTYRQSVGEVNLPPKALGEWTKVGEVAEIWYTRTGRKAPFRFRHPFGKKRLVSLFQGVGKAYLWEHGRFYRLELGHGCRIDDRGLISP